jgi:sugar O-acyltransferase (sialic acid O-acetyltransferase NeuD family)
MPRSLIVIGGGEHARVVIDTARSRPDEWQVVGFVDASPRPETVEGLRVPWLGSDEDVFRQEDWTRNAVYVLGIGWPRPRLPREQIVARYEERGVTWAAVVHSRAWVSPEAKLGRGVVVCAGAMVNVGAVIGVHSVVNTGAVVEHDAKLGAHAHAGPGAIVGGGADVGDGAFLGLGCRIRDHVRVGREATVAMGAVVVSEVANGQTVRGVPARPVTMDGADA